jgi:hypothetical protein
MSYIYIELNLSRIDFQLQLKISCRLADIDVINQS